MFHMLAMCLVQSITKKVISYGQQPFNYKIFNKVFQYMLKSLEMPQKYKSDKKKLKKNWSDNRFLNRERSDYFNKV